ncbi:MAG: HAMP domain-containing protein [Rhodospirillaceae bacterium]|nr:HAMP domain-containing protein [Rhodospirillaceae bacterium]MBT6119341.1 HAMP domain-containing protein [Rhodospirillaceae bacterium]
MTKAPAEPAGAGRDPAVRRRRGRLISPLTRRVLAINVLALAIPVGGLLYLDEYKAGLVEAEFVALRTHGEIVAGALAEGAVTTDLSGKSEFLIERTRQMVRRLVEPTRVRARLFHPGGMLMADSRMLIGSGGVVKVEDLPPPSPPDGVTEPIVDIYDTVAGWFRSGENLERYREFSDQRAQQYAEVQRALLGEPAKALLRAEDGTLVLGVALPVQRYKKVIGALYLTADSQEIDAAIRAVRFDVLKIFAIALAVTVLLSLYLAGTITRPIRRLAGAADLVRRGHGRQHRIPDFSGRRDELGELASALREMTDALWARMDAIERFAADVAHEIKNPLSSLRSAVETAARVKDAEQQRRLMSIIQDDVARLDRLITDISDASRLDAELSREETVPVQIDRLLSTLVDIHNETGGSESPRLILDLAPGADLRVRGFEERLGQVFRNLIVNAISFSPPGGIIRIAAIRKDKDVVVQVEDTGPGIPANRYEEIFDRFYSERPSGEKFGTHSGLGLSISRQIVNAHGGSIQAENRAEGGARFIVRLPAG